MTLVINEANIRRTNFFPFYFGSDVLEKLKEVQRNKLYEGGDEMRTKNLFLAIIFLIAVLAGVGDALAATGIIVRINRPGTEGAIERTDDGSGDLYQFQIPQDILPGCAITPFDEGRPVLFTLAMGRTARDVCINLGGGPGGGF